MNSEAYEVELSMSNGGGNDYLVALLATCTGLPKEEIVGKLPADLQKTGRWPGTSFIKMVRLLGYNCNRRFIEFNARTPWPCILRCQKPTIKGGWWALVYANGQVYDPYSTWCSVQYLDDFVRLNPEARITSMLEIWMG